MARVDRIHDEHWRLGSMLRCQAPRGIRSPPRTGLCGRRSWTGLRISTCAAATLTRRLVRTFDASMLALGLDVEKHIRGPVQGQWASIL